MAIYQQLLKALLDEIESNSDLLGILELKESLLRLHLVLTQRNSQGDETVANAQLVCEKIAILWVMLAKNMQDPNFKAILADEKQSYAFSKTVMSEIRSLGQLTRYKADFVIKRDWTVNTIHHLKHRLQQLAVASQVIDFHKKSTNKISVCCEIIWLRSLNQITSAKIDEEADMANRLLKNNPAAKKYVDQVYALAIILNKFYSYEQSASIKKIKYIFDQIADTALDKATLRNEISEVDDFIAIRHAILAWSISSKTSPHIFDDSHLLYQGLSDPKTSHTLIDTVFSEVDVLFEKIDSIYKEILKNIYNLDSATLTSASGFIKTIADELQNYYLLLTKLSTVNENLLNNPATEETWLSAAEKNRDEINEKIKALKYYQFMLSTLAQSLIAPKSIEQTNEIIDLLIKHETLLEKSDQLWQELSQIEQDLEKQISLYGLRKNNNFSNMNHYCFFPSHSIQQIKVKLLSFKDGIKQDWEPLLDKSHLFASEEEVSKHLTSITDPNCQAIIFAYIQRNFPVGTGENFEFSCYTKVLKAMDGLLVKITQLEKSHQTFLTAPQPTTGNQNDYNVPLPSFSG